VNYAIFLLSAFPTQRRQAKQKRQSQALMEHLGLALHVVTGQACKTAAAFQDIRLVSGL
jgi:preprotein translocase subunit YajC